MALCCVLTLKYQVMSHKELEMSVDFHVSMLDSSLKNEYLYLLLYHFKTIC